MRRWALGAVLVAAAVVAGVVIAITTSGPAPRPHTKPRAPVSAPAPALPAPSGQAFGVNVNRLFNDLSYSQAQIDAQLAAVRATGATLARSDALWQAAEPHAPLAGRHTYDWSFDDQIAGSLAAHGLTWLPIIDYSAPWDESVAGEDHSPPRSNGDYAAYAGAFAARYGSDGTFWRAHPGLTPEPVGAIEIWNEPDNGEFWAPGPNAAAYAQLYLDARAAIDAAHPGIRVVIGGLTTPGTSLPAMVQAVPELAGHVDGVAIHPYGRPGLVVDRVRGARAALVRVGMAAVPLYVTEFGWTTQPPGAVGYGPAAQRPAYIIDVLTTLGHLQCGLAATVLYTWVTPQRNPADPQDWYGIANPADPSAGTPDTAAFAAGLRSAGQPPAGPTPAPCPT
jgi:hypothetical protein